MSKLVPVNLAPAALLHDSAEMFLNDIPHPTKQYFKSTCGDSLDIFEDSLLRKIFSRFSISYPKSYEWETIKIADLLSRNLEEGAQEDAAKGHNTLLSKYMKPLSESAAAVSFEDEAKLLNIQ